MDPTALLTVLGILAASTVLGLVWKQRQGRVRREGGEKLVPRALLAEGAWLTLLQVSSPVCSYCQAMRSVLARVASENEGVSHVEYDIAEIPELIAQHTIRQTPTTLLVESTGRVTHTIKGPTNPPAIAALVAQAREDYSRRTDGYAI